FELDGRLGTAAPATLLWARTTVTVYDDLDRIDFAVATEYDSHNTRVRVAFPLAAKGKHIYGIPYGQLERKPYEPTYTWFGANGDWPAVNWAGIQMPRFS